MFKSCSKCGKIHPKNYQCRVGRTYTGGNERKLRSTYAWTKTSLRVRDESNFLCEICREQGIYNYNNIEVHHIVKVKDDESKLLDNENLICLCQEHHKQADNNEIDKDYLLRLAREREEKAQCS